MMYLCCFDQLLLIIIIVIIHSKRKLNFEFSAHRKFKIIQTIVVADKYDKVINKRHLNIKKNTLG